MLIHNWVFLEQYFAASMTMPIAVSMFRDPTNANTTESIKKINRIVLYSNIGFYTAASAWFLTSSITGKLFWRISMDFIFWIMTFLFLWSFYKIRQMIKKENFNGIFAPSKLIMFTHIFVYSLEMVIFAVTMLITHYYIVAVDTTEKDFEKDQESPGSIDEEEFEKNCRIMITFDAFYVLSNCSYLIHAGLTCFMNIKFSRELQKANF